MTTKQKHLVYNILFLAGCGALLWFLLRAPAETTRPLPRNADHERFMSMGKKEAEQFCESCHAAGKQAPLPDNHPPKNRCLFCHKRK